MFKITHPGTRYRSNMPVSWCMAFKTLICQRTCFACVRVLSHLHNINRNTVHTYNNMHFIHHHHHSMLSCQCFCCCFCFAVLFLSLFHLYMLHAAMAAVFNFIDPLKNSSTFVFRSKHENNSNDMVFKFNYS